MYFSGRVHTILFTDPSQAFYILKMALDTEGLDAATKATLEGLIVVKGFVPGPVLKLGSWFGFEADWTEHAKHGRQLSIQKAPVLNGGWTTANAVKSLSANGVGSDLLDILQATYGDDLCAALGDKDRLVATPGIDEFTAIYVHQRWLRTQSLFRGLGFLLKLNMPPGIVRRVWAKFGDDAEKVLGLNPWALVQVDGITFPQADEIANRMGLDQKSPARLEGAVLGVCKAQKNHGHMYLTTGQLFAETEGFVPGLTHAEFGRALADAHKNQTLVIDRAARTGTTAIYEPWFYELEKSGADGLIARQVTAGYGPGGLNAKLYMDRLAGTGPQAKAAAQQEGATLATVATAAVEDWQQGEHLILSTAQKQGIINALTEPVSVLTGLPGTGKTTSLRAAVRILQEAGVHFLLCAPTGIAAKNLGALTGAPAGTIHRSFSARGVSEDKNNSTYVGVVGESEGATFADKDEVWEYGPQKPYPADVVIADEVSMLDQHLLYRLLTCTGPATRLVIVGDPAQLPSVGPGNVLRDLIQSKRFPTVHLTEIFRQKDTSDIVFAAHAIYRGDMPKCDPPSDFTLVQAESESQTLAIILRLAEKLFAKRENFQILSPRHAGVVGVTNLNAKLRDLLNPPNSALREIRIADDVIREDDRIMVFKNDYKLGIYNGDVGKVTRIDNRAKEIELKIFGTPTLVVKMPFKTAMSSVRLAYACTVHKAQGLEYDVIVMPVVDSFKHQLQRNLLYTAVTRAKTKVFLVGTYSALATSVANDREDLRNTILQDRLRLPSI